MTRWHGDTPRRKARRAMLNGSKWCHACVTIKMGRDVVYMGRCLRREHTGEHRGLMSFPSPMVFRGRSVIVWTGPGEFFRSFGALMGVEP